MGPEKGLSFADPARLASVARFNVLIKESAEAWWEFSLSL